MNNIVEARKDDITYILTEDINKIYQALDKAAATVNALEVYAVTTVDAAAQEVLDKAVAVISVCLGGICWRNTG